MSSQDKVYIEEILPGFYRVEIPLPDSPLKALNSYMIKGGERNLIIDTGMNRQMCHKAMNNAIQELDIDMNHTDLFITHLHIDHVGLVAALATKSMKVYFNRIEAQEMSTSTIVKWAERVTVVARFNGFHEKGIQQMKANIANEEEYRTTFSDFTILAEGDMLTYGDYSLRCIETPGHSRGHMCLYEPKQKVLVSGDHILGDITPNIAARYNDDNPLLEYLTSLDKVYPLDVKLVLPGHRNPLTDLRGRINELKHHHEVRANEILAILKKGRQNAFEIAGQMTWDMSYETWEEFPVFPRWFAFSEALSHLQYLESLGKVTRHRLSDGNIVYSAD